jgi:CBS domain-containing protein
MPTVHDLIRAKSSQDIWWISPDASVYEALQLLAEKKIGAILVMRDGKVEGILSERDCVRKVDLVGKTPRGIKVGEIMTRDVLYVELNQPLEEAMAIMTGKKVRHLPVYDGGKLIGIISIGDVLKEIVSDQKFMLDQFSRYIHGG